METAKNLYNLDEKGFYSMLFIVIALTRVLNELMHGVKEKQVKFKLKRDFKALLRLTKSVHTEFENNIKNDKKFLDSFRNYADDVSEMVHSHIDEMREAV